MSVSLGPVWVPQIQTIGLVRWVKEKRGVLEFGPDRKPDGIRARQNGDRVLKAFGFLDFVFKEFGFGILFYMDTQACDIFEFEICCVRCAVSAGYPFFKEI